eukprot:CAMPEP_0198206086 /NCGR_PEP_ID=MMETSP1445-20131203/9607_1 /TAXON_ID=36898 /ORGANISM="Pyramimonas sp., Strain CCMP2087" /LENGTH=356 /DNA_ID=CAMNT_0043878629 /DNA_START=327 /DNA_END=1397 /DNA_ORIENTATION=+
MSAVGHHGMPSHHQLSASVSSLEHQSQRVDLPQAVQDLIQAANLRWLKTSEVNSILQNYASYGFELSERPPNMPPSGSLFLFDRKQCRFFRKDGHNWRKKADGKSVNETHEKLKDGAVETLNCYYAHSGEYKWFQRRTYWMLGQDNGKPGLIAFVHYLEVSKPRKSRQIEPSSDFPMQTDDTSLSLSQNLIINTDHPTIRKRPREDLPLDGKDDCSRVMSQLQSSVNELQHGLQHVSPHFNLGPGVLETLQHAPSSSQLNSMLHLPSNRGNCMPTSTMGSLSGNQMLMRNNNPQQMQTEEVVSSLYSQVQDLARAQLVMTDKLDKILCYLQGDEAKQKQIAALSQMLQLPLFNAGM